MAVPWLTAKNVFPLEDSNKLLNVVTIRRSTSLFVSPPKGRSLVPKYRVYPKLHPIIEHYLLQIAQNSILLILYYVDMLDQ